MCSKSIDSVFNSRMQRWRHTWSRIQGRYEARKFGVREFALIGALGFFAYASPALLRAGLDPLSLALLPLAMAVGVLVGGVFWMSRVAFMLGRRLTWPTVKFVGTDGPSEFLRVRNCNKIAPPKAQFNRGRDYIAYRWAGAAAQNGVDAEDVKKEGDFLVKRYEALTPVDPDLLVLHGRYMKRQVRLEDALGGGYRWVTPEFMFQHSPLGVIEQAASKPQRSKSGGKDMELDPSLTSDAFKIIGQMRYKVPASMTPATFYAKLHNKVMERAMKRPEDPARMRTVKQLSVGVVAILIGAIFLMVVIGTGEPSERVVQEKTPIEEAQDALIATSTAVALESVLEDDDVEEVP